MACRSELAAWRPGAADDLKTAIAVFFVVGGVILLSGAVRFHRMADDDEGLPASALDKIEHLQPKSAFITGFTWLSVSPKQWCSSSPRERDRRRRPEDRGEPGQLPALQPADPGRLPQGAHFAVS